MHPLTWSWDAWGLGTMLMMLVFWGLVVVGITFAIRWAVAIGRARRDIGSRSEHSPRALCAGEIDKDEFEAKKRDLR